MGYDDAAKSRGLGFSGRVRAQRIFPMNSLLQLDFTFDNLELFEALENSRSHSVDSFELRVETSLEPLLACLPETPGLLSPLKVIKNVHR